jgi:DNA-damage-inducible protein D
MPLLGYRKWERFAETVEQARAVIAAEAGAGAAEREASRQREAFGRTRQVGENFHLSRRACYVTAMRGDSRKPEIRAALLYFAEKTREAEVRATSPALPQDYEEALVHLLGKVRENKQLESKVKELEPAAQAWDVLASASGDYSLRDAAHILNRDPAISTGQNRLLRSIREFDMVDRNGVPYAKHASHLVERATSYNHPHTGEPVLSKQVRVTVQGLRYLHRRLGGEGALQLPISEAGTPPMPAPLTVSTL